MFSNGKEKQMKILHCKISFVFLSKIYKEKTQRTTVTVGIMRHNSEVIRSER